MVASGSGHGQGKVLAQAGRRRMSRKQEVGRPSRALLLLLLLLLLQLNLLKPHWVSVRLDQSSSWHLQQQRDYNLKRNFLVFIARPRQKLDFHVNWPAGCRLSQNFITCAAVGFPGRNPEVSRVVDTDTSHSCPSMTDEGHGDCY